MAVTVKNAVFWDVTPCGSVRTDVSEERIACIIRVENSKVLTATNSCSMLYYLLLTLFLASRFLLD
jgi:hypothetical protein